MHCNDDEEPVKKVAAPNPAYDKADPATSLPKEGQFENVEMPPLLREGLDAIYDKGGDPNEYAQKFVEFQMALEEFQTLDRLIFEARIRDATDNELAAARENARLASVKLLSLFNIQLTKVQSIAQIIKGHWNHV